MTPDPIDIAAVFGGGLQGSSLEEQAAHSTQKFVRSQLQITFDNELATGHRLTASEALNTFGWDVLKKVAEKGSCPLIASPDEPALTLKKRRDDLGLTTKQLAKQAGVREEVVARAETVGQVSGIFDLERIGQAMALDESVLGHLAGAHADAQLGSQLGVRLRESARSADAVRFTATDVLTLAEAAWVIAKCDWLASQDPSSPADAKKFEPSRDYRYRAYDRGYELAARTRKLLNISEVEPISSLKSLAEDRLGIPVIQQALSEKFAGATVANGRSRGVVINEKGMNWNVWVRRTTLAHEIGHLLWDPDDKLERLRVDFYDELDRPYRQSTDAVEIRANAFAVSFLAPPAGVKQIMKGKNDHIDGLADVMTTYGISATAAKYHVWNICHINVDVAPNRLPGPSDDWIARENLAVDYFRPEETPISRRGRFAALVIRALDARRISVDSAAMFLKSTAEEVMANKDFILKIAQPVE